MLLLLLIIALSVTCGSCKSVRYHARDSRTLELIILHNNDMHGRFEQTDKFTGTCDSVDAQAKNCVGGFARVSTVVKDYRREADNGGPAVLYLNAGDTFTGTPWFSIFKDKIASKFLNLLKPDAMCLGNHEFDLGLQHLLPFLNDVNFPVLIANLNNSVDHPLWKTRSLTKSSVFEVRGFQIGIIGYLTPETKTLVGETDIQLISEIDSINKEAESLKNDGVNIIIALGHSGYDVDQKIAKNCPLIDVVVGGHSHTFLYPGRSHQIETSEGPYPTIIQQSSGKEVPVVQAYAFSKYMGVLKLTVGKNNGLIMKISVDDNCFLYPKFNENGQLIQFSGRPILLNHQIRQDPEVLALENHYRSMVDAIMAEVYGETRVLIDGSKCRFVECNVGNMITDAFISARIQQNNGRMDASIAFIGSGDIRSSIKIGKIKGFDLKTILPYENQIVAANVTGKVLRQILEHSVERYSTVIGRGEFLQMSGLHVKFDLTKSEGNRVASVSALCGYCKIPSFEEVDPNRLYGILVTSFVYEGGDGYTMLKDVEAEYMNITVVEAVQSYIKQKGILYPAVEGRIQI